MLFEWDESKDLINQKKHGLSFREARNVFFDPLAVSRPDPYEGEHREQIIGHLYGVLVVMAVYTQRHQGDEDVIRLISARRATSQEKRDYENGQWF